ncbi:MAG TPA: right-handed parallel beta-helix repeat-containing protein, partial [Blastocatellia bacterium]|nr:right-handed parallel beta-helix repeat-containing protein [Blastocatellia bacterium]
MTGLHRTHILKSVDKRRTFISAALIIVGCMVLLESLSIRRVRAATFTVLNTNDSGAGSLRQAITSANGDLLIDTINFNIPGGGVHTITPNTPLPEITSPVIIDGTTQPGWSVGNLVIEISGQNAGALADGLRFINVPDTAPLSFVRGLAINRFDNAGISTQVTHNLTIEGCHLGTDPTGMTAAGNTVGILVQSTIGGFTSSNITIGGDTAAERNVISGNTFLGLRMFAGSLYTVTGNYIGPDKTGMTALGDQSGVDLTGVDCTVGGTTAALRNVISGNGGRGMTLNGRDNVVQGNYFGVAADGTTPMGNGSTGIEIIGNGLSNNDHTIGGVTPSAKNIIAYNGNDGIAIFRDTTPTTGHRILANSIFSNAGRGIDLDDNGLTANDTGDGDDGTNHRQNFPVLASALSTGATTTVTGQLNSEANTSYRIEFFANSSCDPSGNGEGEIFLGFVNTSTNGIGNAAFNAVLSAAPTTFGQFLTATATRNSVPLDTSEFSACIPVTLETFVVTNTGDNGGVNPAPGAGTGTLRQAIVDANANANPNVISFNIPSEGVQTISVAAALPSITTRVIIDGLSQQGASCSSPLIELDGTNSGGGLDGLFINAGNCTVQGLIINRFSGDGISLITNGGNTVRCNRIGTNAAGNADLGNGANGVLVSSSSNNTISENTISGNGLSGVRFVSSSNNVVQGNTIGLSSNGLTKIGNSSGGIIFFTTGTANLIGGTTAAARNIISGNTGVGITLRDAGVANNTIQGNYIGVGATGTGTGLGNTTDGIQISLSSSANTVGGTSPGEGNIIASNVNRGVALLSTAGTGNRILGNSIHSNGTPTNFLGIDLNADGITANDAGDGDAGPNNLQNFPVISAAETAIGLGTSIAGSLNSTANTSFRIEFFVNPTCDALGNGEGETLLTSIDVTTNGSGNASFNFILPIMTTVGHALTATATRNAAPFDTSEFSACRAITAFSPPPLIVTNTNDSGAGSLRQAITSANADPVQNAITFNIPGAGVKTISPLSALPPITQPVIIDGLSQPGATCGSPLIELNGTNAGAGTDGLNISGGNSTVKGLVINRFGGDGIEFITKGTNKVNCSRIGTDQAGLAALPNTGNGIFLNNVSDNQIGGTANDGNLVSGNLANGILIDGATGALNNVIQGNLIGVNATGIAFAGGNAQDGVHIQGANALNTQIGGAISGARNVISNNADDGIETTADASNTAIKGNFIGVSASGNGDAGNADRGITATGTTTPGGTSGTTIIGGTTAAERNVISANTIGIQTIFTSATTTIQGNYIGLGADGTTPLGNTLGVFLNNTKNSLIGGTVAGAGNVISANDESGIFLDGTNNSVQGNLIGTDATGMLDRGNGGTNNVTGGISVGDPNNTIGGPTAAARNVISGNRNGILMALTSANNTIVKNNFIGVNITGTGSLGNTRFGILITSSNNTIGGDPGEGNIIAFNGLNGVGILQGLGNRVTANSIFSNGLLGIDLTNDGVVASNDNLDPDTGANNLQNFPVISSSMSVGGPNINITGTLNSAADAGFSIDFYSNPTCDGNGFGEGQTHIGSTSVMTDAAGNASFNVVFNVAVPAGHRITATATDGTGNTSEFCACSTPTAIELVSFAATVCDTGTLLEWRTGFEANNLGFNLYRDNGVNRELVNRQIVAGSALVAGSGTILGAGRSYSWFDNHQTEKNSYWLEEIDVNGQSTFHGPISATSAAKPPDPSRIRDAQTLAGIGQGDTRAAAVEATSRLVKPTQANLDLQQAISSGSAVKIGVSHEGWYRVTQSELIKAGLKVGTNPRLLQLFSNGAEQPILVTGEADGRFDANDSVEFYGVGLDTLSTDTNIYWLVEGSSRGRRIDVIKTHAKPGGANSFNYSLESRERTIYFSGLLNGEAENFFGRVITSQRVEQTITISSIDESSTLNGKVEVALQGVTDLPGNTDHQVTVSLNGSLLGRVVFDGRRQAVQSFPVPYSMLVEGPNTISLIAEGGPSDI